VVRGGVGAEPVTGTAPGYLSGVDPPPRRTVHLLAVPLEMLVELQLYFDDMVRELQLIAVGRADAGAANRLHRLAVHTQHEIARARNDLHVQARAGLDAGEPIADLVVDLRPSAVAASRALIPLVEAFDEASREGSLLAAPCTPEARQLLEWIVAEIEVQLVAGERPRPFTTEASA
jgi:hypothetical protein